MKRLLFSLLFLFPFIASAQDTSPVLIKSKIDTVYIDIREVENSKENLFKNAQSWIAKSYGDYKAVIQFEDKESGKLIIKGTKLLKIGLYHSMKYTLDLDIRDGKYRAVFSDFEYGLGLPGVTDIRYSHVSKLKSQLDRLNELNEDIYSAQQSGKKSKLTASIKERDEYVDEQERLANAINSYIGDTFRMLNRQMQIKDDF